MDRAPLRRFHVAQQCAGTLSRRRRWRIDILQNPLQPTPIAHILVHARVHKHTRTHAHAGTHTHTNAPILPTVAQCSAARATAHVILQRLHITTHTQCHDGRAAMDCCHGRARKWQLVVDAMTKRQGHKGTRVQEYKGTRYKGTRVHGYKDTRIQGHKGTRA